jgi:hypothetical protein
MVSARVPDKLDAHGIHATIRGNGRCLIGATQYGAAGYDAYHIPRDERGVPLDSVIADNEHHSTAEVLVQ